MTEYLLTNATCRACGYVTTMTADGKVGPHGPERGVVCPGSLRSPRDGAVREPELDAPSPLTTGDLVEIQPQPIAEMTWLQGYVFKVIGASCEVRVCSPGPYERTAVIIGAEHLRLVKSADVVLEENVMRKTPERRELLRTLEVTRTELAERQRFKDFVHAYLDRHGVPHHPPGKHGPEGCRIGDRLDWVLGRVDFSYEPNPQNEKLAGQYRAALRKTEDGKVEGTLESLGRTAAMLDAHAPDAFPANELGQVHFARAMMESAADEIHAFLDTNERLFNATPGDTAGQAAAWSNIWKVCEQLGMLSVPCEALGGLNRVLHFIRWLKEKADAGSSAA